MSLTPDTPLTPDHPPPHTLALRHSAGPRRPLAPGTPLTACLDLVRPTARAARLPVVAVGPVLALALLAVLSLLERPAAMLLVLVGLLMVAPIGYLFDDAAADVLAASPSTLARRRLARVALGAPLLLTGWLVAVDPGAPTSTGTPRCPSVRSRPRSWPWRASRSPSPRSPPAAATVPPASRRPSAS